MIRDPDRRTANPDHPYWTFVDEVAEAWKHDSMIEGSVVFPTSAQRLEAQLPARFPEVERDQFDHDVELAILRSYR